MYLHSGLGTQCKPCLLGTNVVILLDLMVTICPLSKKIVSVDYTLKVDETVFGCAEEAQVQGVQDQNLL